MDVLVWVSNVLKGVAILAVPIALWGGSYLIGYLFTGQSRHLKFEEYTDHRKAHIVSVVVFVVLLGGTVLWALTGAPTGSTFPGGGALR